MIQILKVPVVSAVIIIGMLGCSASKETTTTQSAESVDSNIPSWYQKTTFQSDSTSFAGFGEAVASDSISAMNNAELQARINLEKGVSEVVEATRQSFSKNGNNTVDTPEFLIMLRNASQPIQDEGSVFNRFAVSKDGYYRGYALVEISRANARRVLNSGFEANQGFRDILNSRPLFE